MVNYLQNSKMMIPSNVEIIGITPPDQFPIIEDKSLVNEIIVTDEVTFPRGLNVEDLSSVTVEPKIIDYHVIKTPIGDKIVIRGIINQTFEFNIKKPAHTVSRCMLVLPYKTQSVYVNHFSTQEKILTKKFTTSARFENFILLPENVTIDDLTVLVEDIKVEPIKCNGVRKFVLLFIQVKVTPPYYMTSSWS